MGLHPNTRRFVADWQTRRGVRPLPRRRDLDPALFGNLAPQLFMLGREGEATDLFRVAGALLVDLHGRELRGTPFLTLWARRDRATVEAALDRARRIAAPLVLNAEGVTAEGAEAHFELTVAPVAGATGEAERTFGLHQPTSPLSRLRGAPLGGLRLLAVTPAAEPRPAHLKLVSVEGRRVA